MVGGLGFGLLGCDLVDTNAFVASGGLRSWSLGFQV